jgi:molybdopterin-guanine dinucleotide biosynthesis protein A
VKVNEIKASGAILIGGKSSRFGNDKANLIFSGEILAQRTYNRLDRILDDLFFISDQSDKYTDTDFKVYADLGPSIGPLSGLITALKYCRHPYCFVTACDLPFFDERLLNILWQQRKANPDIIAPIWQDKIEPLAAFYHKTCIAAIENALAENRFMMKGFWQNMQVELVDLTRSFSTEELKKMFFNINTVDAYNKAVKMSELDN